MTHGLSGLENYEKVIMSLKLLMQKIQSES